MAGRAAARDSPGHGHNLRRSRDSSVLARIDATGNVKRDWEIISLLASEMGYPMHYDSNQQIWDEMRELCPLFYGVYEKWARWVIFRPCVRMLITVHAVPVQKIISSIRRAAKVAVPPRRGALLSEG